MTIFTPTPISKSLNLVKQQGHLMIQYEFLYCYGHTHRPPRISMYLYASHCSSRSYILSQLDKTRLVEWYFFLSLSMIDYDKCLFVYLFWIHSHTLWAFSFELLLVSLTSLPVLAAPIQNFREMEMTIEKQVVIEKWGRDNRRTWHFELSKGYDQIFTTHMVTFFETLSFTVRVSRKAPLNMQKRHV